MYPGEVGGEDDSGGDESTGSGGSSGGDFPMPEPQPADGLYQHCLTTDECDLMLTEGCFVILDENMQVLDGYCASLCTDVMQCGSPPMVMGVQTCAAIGDTKMCAITCQADYECPYGMVCRDLFGFGLFCV